MTSSTRPNAVHRIRQAVSAAVAGLTRSAAPAASRALARMEPLEERRLMAGDASVVQSLPFSLEFDGSRPGTILDKDGEGTGFTWVQPNTAGNEYQPGLMATLGEWVPWIVGAAVVLAFVLFRFL